MGLFSRIALASSLAFAALMSGGPRTPALGQDATAVADMDKAWPRLPDGRVVFTIYGVRLAVPTCDHCLRSFEFWSIGVGHLPLRTAIAEPRRLREIIAASTQVFLTMMNTWDPRVSREPFLDKFDPHSLPPSMRIDLDVFKNKEPSECWLNIKNVEYQVLHATATQPQAPGPDGFYVLSGPMVIHGNCSPLQRRHYP